MTPPEYLRERGPVRPELEFHRDAGHDADGEVDTENAYPEPRGIVPLRLAGAQADALEHDDEQRQPHRQLGEEIVIGDRERELQPVPDQRI